jgi:anti-anti-sigma factor
VSTLRASVTAGESGPVITLSGETDLTTVAELSELVTAQISGGTLHLTIEASGLAFADTASVRVLVLAAVTLRQRGGSLMLLRRPQPALARMLELLSADQMITIRHTCGITPAPNQQPRRSGARTTTSPRQPTRRVMLTA